MMGKLTGRRALITGSSSGIGAGIALAFADEGADVVVNYPDDQQRDHALAVVAGVESRGRRAFAVMADVSREDHVDKLIDQAVDAMGGIDILINNAGIVHIAPVEDIPIEAWDRLLAVHLRSVFLTTRRILPMMYNQDYGRVINTASQLAYKGAPGLTHYTAAKGAIISFTRSLALEIGARNVTANCVAPGATRTPILDKVPAELIDVIRDSIPKKRLAEVDDIVPTYVFLASDESRHFHGQCLSPNGGDVFL